MDLLLNPNTAYFLLVIGFSLTLLAIVTPGTGVLEVIAFFLLAISGYIIFKIGFNLWALVILVLAIFPYFYATRKPKRRWALLISLIAVIVGSIYIFPSTGLRPSVNPILAVILSLTVLGFFWFTIDKTIQAHLKRPIHDLQGMIGHIGEAKTAIHECGSAQVDGELWSARSTELIPAGRSVRVVSREGFTIIVEPASTPEK